MRHFPLLTILYLTLFITGCGIIKQDEPDSTVEKNNGWFYLSENECYEPLGHIKENPDKDEAGRIINCYDENGEQHGVRIYMYASQGTKEHEGCYNHGENVGRDIWYYKNGNIKSDRYYHVGNYVSSTYYYENGQLDKKTFTKNGNPDGDREMFYQNGQPKFKGSFVDGKNNGTWLYYYEEGTLMNETIYDMDTIVSDKYYDRQGNEIDEKTFEAIHQTNN